VTRIFNALKQISWPIGGWRGYSLSGREAQEAINADNQTVQSIMTQDFPTLISNLAYSAGIALSSEQISLCSGHLQIMLEWNPRLNLTRITQPEEVVVKHLLDSIMPAKFLPSSGRSLDIGSGTGFPGIPLKILNPALQMVLLDSSRKKTSFLAAAVAGLGLKNIRAAHGRWEDFAGDPENSEGFRLITMRAVRLEAEHLSSLASQLLSPGGVFAWWAGPESESSSRQIQEAEFSGLQFNQFTYNLPGLKERSIWTWRKISGKSASM
jgi:16S rRNA (guanine527-N7)-methyltransferase